MMYANGVLKKVTLLFLFFATLRRRLMLLPIF